MKELKLDNNTYYIPTGAHEFKLRDYEKVVAVIDSNTTSGHTLPLTFENVLDIISIATKIDKDKLSNSPVEFTEFLINELMWLFTLKTEDLPIKDHVIINNVKYTYSTENAVLTTREHGDIDEIIMRKPKDEIFAYVLAIRLRKENEKYDSKILESRKNMFLETPISEILPIGNFFLSNENLLQKHTEIYHLMVEQAWSQHQTLIELINDGDGMQRLPAWQKKIILTWMQYLTNQLSKHSSLSLT